MTYRLNTKDCSLAMLPVLLAALLIQACGGNASEAARRARMDRPYLLGLLRKHGLR